ncbi:hypothetical protein D3C85_643900 [compost metagenome]
MTACFLIGTSSMARAFARCDEAVTEHFNRRLRLLAQSHGILPEMPLGFLLDIRPAQADVF